MSYELLIAVQCLSIILLTLESIYIFFNWGSRQHSYLFIYCFSTLINNIGYLMEMMARSSEEALMGTQICYLGKVLIPLSFLVFIMSFCNIKIPQKVYVGLTFLHAGVFFLVLSSRYQKLFYTGYTHTHEGIFPHNVYGHGPVYWIYMVLIFLYFVVAFFTLVKTILSEKQHEKRVILFLLLASVLLGGGSITIFLTGITKGYDITALAYTICTILMYIALFRYNLMDTLELVKEYVVDNLSEGIIAVDESGRIIYCNGPAKKIYPDVCTGRKFVPEEISISAEKKEDIIKENKIYMSEVQPLYQNRILRGAIYALTDVTEERNYTMELQKQKELAEAANNSKSAFLSVVSHEIRTPMNAVVGMTDLLLRDKDSLNGKQEKYLKNIKNSGAALVMIVNDILDKSKIEAGKMEIVEEVYELRPMAEDVKLMMENLIGSKPIQLLFVIDDNIPQFLIGDSLRIRQILINLLNNAVKFTEEGHIQLSVRCVKKDRNGCAIRFSVKDSGQGMKQEDLGKLGEAFTRVDVKKNHNKEGTGLGLSISRDFISMMGGQLEVASEYGKGSEFFFTVRQGIVTETESSTDSEVQKQVQIEREPFTVPDARVLLVDDSEINLLIAQELLSLLEMTVDTANSGEKAIKRICENKYDIIFMDYMMPYMDGVETTEKIRKLAQEYEAAGEKEKAEYLRTVPIITLSGDTSEETKEKFLHAGINDFTEKPIELKRLKKLLLRWLPEEMIKKA